MHVFPGAFNFSQFAVALIMVKWQAFSDKRFTVLFVNCFTL